MARAFSLLTAILLAGAAFAADPFYLGVWKVDSSVVAPWWNSPEKPFPEIPGEFVGKTLVIKPASMAGPNLLTCKNPRYKLADYPADWLFQGSFGEMHDKDKSVDPAKLAAGLGFRGARWKTLQTGCANELEFHFLDPNTAAFGLDNYVFILKKQ